MVKGFMVGTALLAMLATSAALGQEPTTVIERQPQLPTTASGSDDERRVDVGSFVEVTRHKVLLVTIARWLSVNFDLPLVLDPPRLALLPPDRMAALFQAPPERLSEGPNGNGHLEGATSHDIVALYSDVQRTIYLPEGWTGESPAELSILVHELVHHIQHVARLTYACRAAREKIAYAAQNRWLQLFDRDLASEFGIDPFTLLVNTSCIH